MEEESEEESLYSPSEKSSEGSAAEHSVSSSSHQRVQSTTSKRQKESEETERELLHVSQAQKGNADSAAAKQTWERIDLYAYREILNEVIHETVNQQNRCYSQSIPTSQIGYTTWSAQEKESFFYALDRIGKDNVQALSEAIKTKSQPEIRAYITLLQENLVERNEKQEHHGLLGYSDLPAALEIGWQCEAMLNEAAKALAERQFRYELKQEKNKFNNWSIVDRQAVFLLADGSLDEKVLESMPMPLQSAMKLLKVETLVDLSDQIFMNPNYISEVRESNGKARIEPSILTTAILDFQTLVISLTKRLVQSALFFAMSRVKACKSRPFVKKQDVYAALDILGMNGHDHDFWPIVARKYSLDVYDNVPYKGQPKGQPKVKYSYPQVEQMLRSDADDWDQPEVEQEAALPEAQEAASHEGRKHELDADDDASYFSGSSSNKNKASHTAYAQVLDLRASRTEEAHLLSLLCDNSAVDINEGDKELPKAPRRKRKSEDLVDWRDWVGYKSEWERYKTPLEETDFRENRMKRRRTRSPSVQSEEADSDEVVTSRENREVRPSTAETAKGLLENGPPDFSDDIPDESEIVSNGGGANSEDDESSIASSENTASNAEHQPISAYAASSNDPPEDSEPSDASDHPDSMDDDAQADVMLSSKPAANEDEDEDENHENDEIEASSDQNSSSASTSEMNDPHPSFGHLLANQFERDARTRSQKSPNNLNGFQHGPVLLQSSPSPAAQDPSRDDSDTAAVRSGRWHQPDRSKRSLSSPSQHRAHI